MQKLNNKIPKNDSLHSFLYLLFALTYILSLMALFIYLVDNLDYHK